MTKTQIESVISYDAKGDMFCKMKVSNGRKSISKTLSLDEYINTISESVKITLPSVCSGFLPYGTLATWVSEKSRKALFFVPAGKRPLRIKDKLVFIPFPSVLFLLSTTGEVHMWSLQEQTAEQVNEGSKLYSWPFGHVYDDGRLCTGSVETKFTEFSEIPVVVGNILSGTNSHSNNGEDMGKNIQRLLKGNLENYPIDTLKPVKAGAKNVKDIFQRI